MSRSFQTISMFGSVARRKATRLLLLNSGLLDHLLPLVDVGLQPGRNLLRRTGLCLDAEFEQPLFHLGVGEYSLQRGIERVHNLPRRACRCKQSFPVPTVLTV